MSDKTMDDDTTSEDIKETLEYLVQHGDLTVEDAQQIALAAAAC